MKESNAVTIIQKYICRYLKMNYLLTKTIPEIKKDQLFNSFTKEELLILKGLEMRSKNKYNNRKGLIEEIDKRIKPKSKNKGEKGETKIIEYLFDIRNDLEKIFQIFGIKSKIKLIDPSNNEIITDKKTINKSKRYFKADIITDKKTINKSKRYFKADIIIDFIDLQIRKCVSIKCFDGEAPTLLNHTHRAKDYFQNKLSSEKLEKLDSVISKRNTIGKQDVKFEEIKDKFNEEEIDVLVEVISYFTFDGTGCYESKCPADSILIVNDSNNIISTSKFINCKEEQDKVEYIKSILPILSLNMRGGKHGLPGKTNYEEEMKLCEPWLFHDTKYKLCGALAIRFIKLKKFYQLLSV